MTKRIPLVALWTCMIFTCTVLLPPAAVAGPSGPESLRAVDAADSPPARTGFWRRVGRWLHEDWKRTRSDVRNIRDRIGDWRRNLFGKTGATERLRKVHDLLAGAMEKALDELGPHEFLSAMERAAGVPVLPGDGSRLPAHQLRGALLRGFERDFAVLGPALVENGRETREALDRADAMVQDMVRGDETAAVVERHLRPLMDRAPSRGRGRSFFKAAWKVLRTLFFCAALGALGMVSLGFIAYGLTVEFFAFTAVGGAMAIASLVGIVRYVVQCIKSFRPSGGDASPPPAAVPLPAADLMGGE